MFYLYKLNSNNNLNIKFDNLFKKIIKLLEAKKKLVSLVYIEKKVQKIEAFIEKCNYKTPISFTSNHLLISLSILLYQSIIFLNIILIQVGRDF